MSDAGRDEALLALLRQAACSLPADVESALETALAGERDPLARLVLGQALRNGLQARAEALPLCEDRGRPVFFVADEAMTGVVKRAARRARAEGYLGAPARLLPWEGAGDSFAALVQGRACRRAARVLRLPSAEEGTLAAKVARAVARAKDALCPPLVVGVGLGETRAQARLAALRALLRPLDDPLTPLEERLLEAVRDVCRDAPILGLRLRGRLPASWLALEFLCRSARRLVAPLPR